MSRVNLTNANGWFDKDKSESFNEETFWDGRNNISKSTGSLTEHEELFLTSSNNWVLHYYSNWRGILPRYEKISEYEAILWLIKNEYFDYVKENFPGKLDEYEI